MQYKLQHGVSKKAELESECFCFDEFPERRFERAAAKPQPEKLPGDLQKIEYWFVVGFLLQLKGLFVGGQDRPYSFRNARNREDAAQRLQSLGSIF
jgi:hypothetical protein